MDNSNREDVSLEVVEIPRPSIGKQFLCRYSLPRNGTRNLFPALGAKSMVRIPSMTYVAQSTYVVLKVPCGSFCDVKNKNCL